LTSRKLSRIKIVVFASTAVDSYVWHPATRRNRVGNSRPKYL